MPPIVTEFPTKFRGKEIVLLIKDKRPLLKDKRPLLVPFIFQFRPFHDKNNKNIKGNLKFLLANVTIFFSNQ